MVREGAVMVSCMVAFAEKGLYTQKAKQSKNGKVGKNRNLDPKVSRNIRLSFTPNLRYCNSLDAWRPANYTSKSNPSKFNISS